MKTIVRALLIIVIVVLCNRCEKKNLPSVYTGKVMVFSEAAYCYGWIITNGGEEIDEYGFIWSKSDSSEIQNSKVAFDNGTNNFETIISDLSPGTTYFVKSYAANSEGTAYGEEKEMTTTRIGAFSDNRDGKTYKWVEIGNQIWMAENLSYIPYVSPAFSDSAIFVYNYKGYSADEAIKTVEFKTYGCLYSFEISLDVCPDGWRLPSDGDWQELERFIGMTSRQIGQYDWHGTYQDDLLKVKGTTDWSYPFDKPNNSTSFSALASGYHNPEYESYANKYTYFHDLDYSTYFWSSTIIDDFPLILGLDSYHNGIMRTLTNSNYACSIRCIKD
ncbi:MAG: hypothetical protein NTV31_14545 [Bacteroidia bacterium]|nr:hypothetical protein [Bacteroidia bacterium]